MNYVRSEVLFLQIQKMKTFKVAVSQNQMVFFGIYFKEILRACYLHCSDSCVLRSQFITNAMIAHFVWVFPQFSILMGDWRFIWCRKVSINLLFLALQILAGGLTVFLFTNCWAISVGFELNQEAMGCAVQVSCTTAGRDTRKDWRVCGAMAEAIKVFSWPCCAGHQGTTSSW